MARGSTRQHDSRRGGFTLVELLTVIGIIGVLLAIVLPVVSRARESANRIKCASNLRSLGQIILMFAKDHHGRVPEGQNTPYSGAGGFNPTWMYTKDYFVLVDQYGANQALFICPSSATASLGPSAFPYGQGSEIAARAELDELPDNPKKVQAGENDLTVYWVGFDYAYMGRNIQEALAPGGDDVDGAPFEVTRLGRNTHMGTSDDANPPLMADQAWYQPTTGYHANHGRNWSIPSFDATPSLNPWSRGTASAHVGDIRLNELYSDGHVAEKSPDLHCFYNWGNSYYFR
ncbi:MAG: N-terminal cleavage protein [Phycisphaerales bacterium]|jgi:prepilin-type N-terminal cleavage/methylation domain-containing protein|nr:N-terminal cleavage protein [Phycisphaerales bacterium]MDB5333998.1 N-terminal cleavage protein [Phycisphaerales bacterium]